ncbi:Endonuclease/exonuclease/phosphatase family domain-containing protein 1 [Paragonimus heterotremus]|uniref:Endonuclease/exonuclease/phosphatase family domain-containing protein 1 n=1 Tax=Paragonimus heterotremus TaxID=100268 RepID=A0A8J4T610_9TREM|nr:Endonuclease/exonuclease/phosphatase family domain-containing protein 1 [Paragonimus heterotremus]
MRSIFELLCCLRCNSRHPARKSNVATIREILAYFDTATEDEHATINVFLYNTLINLMEMSQIEQATNRVRAPLMCPLIDRYALAELQTTIKSLVSARSYGAVQSLRMPQFSQLTSEPRVDANQPNLRREGSSNPLRYSLRECSQTQLELLLQLDCMKYWHEYLANTKLGCLPPLDLRDACTVSTGGCLRLASWNLNRFTLAKARHPGFREIVCLTILRANIALLVLQEIASLDVADMLCAELNSPMLPHVRQWVSQHPPSHVPRWCVATSNEATGAMFRGREYALFLFNTTAGIHIQRTGLLESSNASQSSKLFSRSPCSALCFVRSSRIILVSVHLKARGLRNSMIDRTVSEVEHLETLVQAFYDTQPVNTHLIIVGDFNLNPLHEAFDGLRRRGFLSVLDGSQSTTVSTTTSNTVPASSTINCPSSSCQTAYDNVWLSPGLTRGDNPSHLVDAFYTGSGGVIGEGLRHPLIPDDTGAGANGFVSDHCPIWFDLRIL